MAAHPLQTPAMSNGTTAPAPPPKKRGCLFYGCLSMAIIAVVMAVMFAVGVLLIRKAYVNTVNQFTDTTPTKFESVNYPQAERDALKARVQTFQSGLKEGRSGFELVLSADDLNVLIEDEPKLRGKLFVAITNDRVTGRISLPLDEVVPLDVRKQFTKLQGRYLNAEAAFRVVLEGGALDVRLEDLSVRGQSLEKNRFLGSAVKEMKKQNLAKDIQGDPQVRDNISRFESLQVRDGKVIIKGK